MAIFNSKKSGPSAGPSRRLMTGLICLGALVLLALVVKLLPRGRATAENDAVTAAALELYYEWDKTHVPGEITDAEYLGSKHISDAGRYLNPSYLAVLNFASVYSAVDSFLLGNTLERTEAIKARRESLKDITENYPEWQVYEEEAVRLMESLKDNDPGALEAFKSMKESNAAELEKATAGEADMMTFRVKFLKSKSTMDLVFIHDPSTGVFDLVDGHRVQ